MSESDRGLLVIVNPTAGGGRTGRAWPGVWRRMRDAGIRFDEVLTTERGHARSLAADAGRKGYSGVVAAGGDGTVQEVANGLLNGSDGAPLPLGLLPLGSGNDFAKLTGVSDRGLDSAIAALADPHVRPVDVGRVGDRYFTNGVGIGFDARVGIEAGRIRWLRGMPMYGLAALRVLRHLRTPRMRVEIDGAVVIDQPLTLVTIGNGGCHGGGFWLCPDARIDDGHLDVCAAEALGRLQILHFLPKVMRGSHTALKYVSMWTARRVRVTAEEPVPVHADGETYSEGTTEIDMEILPGRLPLIGLSGP